MTPTLAVNSDSDFLDTTPKKERNVDRDSN